MSDERQIVLDAITAVAPDVDPSAIDPSDDVWYSLELDSMDQLGVMVHIHDKTGVEIPEADYPRLLTVDDIADRLRQLRVAPEG